MDTEKVLGGASSTPALSQEEISQMDNRRLLTLYKETGDMDLKWALVLRFVGLVRTMAFQVYGLYSSFAQPEDIVNEGVLVLMNAIDKFDLSKDVKFETYVSKRLRGMIIDLARERDWRPRQVRQKAQQLKQATDDLSICLGRTPSSKELAEYLGISLEEYAHLCSETAATSPVSLEALLESSGGASQGIPGDLWDTTSEKYEEQELREVLRQGIASLRPGEQMVLSLYYEKDLSMKEIAQVLHVTAARVSQIHSRAIRELRTYMKRYLEP